VVIRYRKQRQQRQQLNGMKQYKKWSIENKSGDGAADQSQQKLFGVSEKPK
jgi:hypothetical protein